MDEIDEPVLNNNNLGLPSQSKSGDELSEKIGKLFLEQEYGILCSQGDGQPYGSLMAFATTEDLACLIFITQIETRKYSLLEKCKKVAFVVDNRSKYPQDMMKVEAVTATGECRIVEESELDRYKKVLLKRHPYLKDYTSAKSCRLFCMEVKRYFHVARLQEVSQWQPLNI